ncbi:hypothetical protein AVEN_256026-1 [Araneus ventricosus]|uniref:Uncharacterized protein n=1 Tax=Araneus ventricosus TaxID=182803 RepID=A0A4Y2NEI7_ARAVE|nr:hypothetical protein AVEN_256026-1 [Araneus ventricosus]
MPRSIFWDSDQNPWQQSQDKLDGQAPYTADLQWNRVSNLEPSGPKAETLPLGHSGLELYERAESTLPEMEPPRVWVVIFGLRSQLEELGAWVPAKM